MSRVYILGTGPLPIEQDSYIYSSSNRTWQIAKALLDDGHRVHVVAFRPTRTQAGERIPDPDWRHFEDGLFSLDSVDLATHFMDNPTLEKTLREFEADAVIGINAYPSERLATLNPPVPFWADMNGFNMGEVQIRAFQTDNNDAIQQGWQQEVDALLRADVFSSASMRQRYALIGQLAAIGRLRKETCGYEFVHTVPVGREDPPPAPLSPPLRAALLKPAVLALWVGCYNYQFDTKTLFEGFEAAMAECPDLHFVSTGGKVDGHNETSFGEFYNWTQSSPYRDRYHFVGWLPWDEFDALLRGADMGVTMDLPCYETELGARNRLTEMMRAGLPAISTIGPEITTDITVFETGWGVEFGNANSLKQALLAACHNPAERQARGANARRVFCERYTLSASTAALRNWAKHPQFAPDHGLEPLLVTTAKAPTIPETPESGWRRLLKRFAR